MVRTPGVVSSHRRMPNLAAVVVLEDPEPRRVPAVDDPAQALGPLLDVDRRLGT